MKLERSQARGRVKRNLLATVLFAFACTGFAARADELDKQLYELRSKWEDYVEWTADGRFEYKNLGQLEKQYLDLTREYSSGADVGRIYFDLMDLYCQSVRTNSASVIRYARETLRYPLDDTLKIRAHIYLGDALGLNNRGVRGPLQPEARRDAALAYLDGLKIALAHNIPAQQVERPRVDRFSGRVSDPEAYKALLKEREEQLAASQRAVFINHMVLHRDTCVMQVISLYSREPYDTEELRRIATDVLEDEDAVSDLVEKVTAAIRERTKKEMAKLTDEVIENVEMPPVEAQEPAPAAPPAEEASQAAAQAPPAPPTDETETPSRLVPILLAVVAVAAALAGIAVAYRLARQER